MQRSLETTSGTAAALGQARTGVLGSRHRLNIAALADWKICALCVAASAVLFIALFNPYWVPSGDGDLYVAIARSISQGNGFKFNGQFVNICPPGWPLIIAGVMQISPTFAAFKIITITSMLVSLGTWFFVLRRLTSPAGAAAVVMLTAILAHVYSLTFWTHSEAVFCVTSTVSLLIAFQIIEGRGGLKWRVPLLLLLCATGILIRWAALIQPLVVCALLMNGKRWWRMESLGRWGYSIAVMSVTFATFVVLRHALALTPEQEIDQREAGAVFEEVAAQPRASATADSRKVDIVNLSTNKDSTIGGELTRRAVESGNWFSWLFWQPFRFAAAVPQLAWAGIVVGWVIIAALGAKLIESLGRRQWMWLGLAGYCAALCINWPNANARYLVPVTPLLMVGAIQGIQLLWIGSIGSMTRDKWVAIALASSALTVTIVELGSKRHLSAALVFWTLAGVWVLRLWARSGPGHRPAALARLTVGAFVLSIALVNTVLYAIDVKVARSRDFYSRYEAGFNQQLIQACYQLNQLGVNDAELAVAERYANLGKVRKSKYAVRAAVLLTGRAVQTVRDKMAGEPKPPLLRWAQTRRVVYYLDQRPSVPWRLWHFVVPRKLNEVLVGERSVGSLFKTDDTSTPRLGTILGPDSGGWALYRFSFTPIPVLPTAKPANFGQRLLGRSLRIEWPTKPPSTQPAIEYRRTSDDIELPQPKNWPTRVPGM